MGLTDRLLFVIASYLFIIAVHTDDDAKGLLKGWFTVATWIGAPLAVAFCLWVLK